MLEKSEGTISPREQKENPARKAEVEVDPTMVEAMTSAVEKEGYKPEEVRFVAGFTTEQYSEDDPESHRPFFTMEFRVEDHWYTASWDQQLHGGTKLMVQEK